MSSIVTNNIDANFPIQGQDNSSQGFRDNFGAIKTALSIAKTEITALETNTAKTNTNNNYNGFLMEEVLANNISQLFKNKGIPESQQIIIDVQDCQFVKIRFIGNTVVRFTNWPNTTSLGKAHKMMLHLRFNLNSSDPNLMNYKINFSTDGGGEIKGHTEKNSGDEQAFKYNLTLGGWHLKPYINLAINSEVNDYEHVFEAWSYDEGQTVFLNYKGSYV